MPDGATDKLGSRDLAAALRREILDGKLLKEDRLPPERALADQHGLARGTVRAALSHLEDQGLIERRAGSGAYVAWAPADQANSIVETTRPVELVDARFALEPQICRLAVLHATERDLGEVERHMEEMERPGVDTLQFSVADGAFHHGLARATNNSLLIWFSEQIGEVRSHDQWAKMRGLTLNPEIIQLYNIQHRAIVEAIRAREPEQAARRMREHLESARRSLSDVPER